MSRGSYTAAWKAFNKARELYPESVYGMYQMASVKQVYRLHLFSCKLFFLIFKEFMLFCCLIT